MQAHNYYCGSRYTEDVDASFSRRLAIDYSALVIDYQREDGKPSAIYFDQNYNPTLSLMHEDYESEALEWKEIGNENRIIKLRVLSPIDLAVSKISRFTDRDRDDILNLAAEGYFTADELRQRAFYALNDYVGNVNWVKNSIDIICQQIEAITKETADQPVLPADKTSKRQASALENVEEDNTPCANRKYSR